MRLPSLALTLALATAACSAGSNVAGPSSNGTVPTGLLSANINGTSWKANTLLRASHINGIVAISGNDVDQTLAMALPADAPGTYGIGLLSAVNAELTTKAGDVWAASGNIGNGSVTITSLTATNVTGTFAFTLAKSGSPNKSITNGTFNMNF